MRVSSLSGGRLSRSFVAFCAASLPVVTSLAIAVAPSPAYAQEASSQDIAQARQLGGQAQAAYDAGNYAESEKLWFAAAKLYSQAPSLTLGLARTQAKLGHVVAAQESYNKIIREWSNVASPPPAFKDALEAAKAEVGAVSAKVATVLVTVEGPAAPVVTIDGQTVPAAALGLKRPVDPGQHVVKATADGYKAAETAFSVAEGGTADAKVKMEKVAGGAVAVPGATPAPGGEPGGDSGPAKAGGSSNKTFALVSFAVGGAGLVFGAITGLIAVGKHGDLADKCKDGNCPSTEQDSVNSYKTMGTLSTVGFIVAGVGAAAGVIFLVTAPKETASAGSSRYATVHVPTKREQGVTLGAYFGGTSAGLAGSF